MILQASKFNRYLVGMTIFFATTASAMEVSQYRKLRTAESRTDSAGILRIYIRGLQDGIEWSNAFLTQDGRTKIYCLPRNLSLNTDNYMQFIDEAVDQKRNPEIKGTEQIELHLLLQLQQKFPC